MLSVGQHPSEQGLRSLPRAHGAVVQRSSRSERVGCRGIELLVHSPSGVYNAAPMRRHLFALLLRQYIEHKNPANLRVHVLSNAVLWMSLCTLLSQIPAPVAVPLLG